MVSLLLSSVVAILQTQIALSQISYCPTIFQYENNGKSGIITISPSSNKITKVETDVIYPGSSLDDQSGSLKTVKSFTEILNDIYQGKNIQFRLNFAKTNITPIIQIIKVNGEVKCRFPTKYKKDPIHYEETVVYPRDSQKHSISIKQSEYLPENSTLKQYRIKRAYFPAQFQRHRQQNSNLVSQTIPNDVSWVRNNNCGNSWRRQKRIASTYDRRIGGTPTSIGEFPWMVPLQDPFGNYFCAGTLISEEYIITAAHCVENRDKKDIILSVGRYNVSEYTNNGVRIRRPREIIIHPNYGSQFRYSQDVALMKIKKVPIGETIRPICLWTKGKAYDGYRWLTGTVTGWGLITKDFDSMHSTVPLKFDLTINTMHICQKNFPNIISRESLCAGGRKTGPCSGDSGGGLYIRFQGVWFLRGITSRIPFDKNSCKNEYSVFEDIAYYLDWLKEYLA